MKNRTDFVKVGVKEQLLQGLRNQIEVVRPVLWALLGFVVGLGNMMLEIAPFGAALCAAAPFGVLVPVAIGSGVGSLLLSSLVGGSFTIKYPAAVLLIALVRRMGKEQLARFADWRPLVAAALAFLGMLLPSLAVLLAQPFSGYRLVLSLAEATVAAACAYFLDRSLRAFSLGQGLANLTRADFISVVLTACIGVISLSNITFAGVSFGRLLAAMLVLLCALLGGESWGAAAGATFGAAVSLALFPKVQLLGMYALAGLLAGVFSGLGKFGCAGAYAMTYGAMCVIAAPAPVLPLLYETLLSTVGLMLLPESAVAFLRQKAVRRPSARADKSIRQLLLERLEESSRALREIAHTTQAVSQQLDKAKAGSLEQVYDSAVDEVCRKCALKTRCWQQEYGDTVNVFNHLTPVLRKDGSVCEEDFIYPLSARCSRRAQLAEQVNLGYQELTKKEGMSRKVARVRSVVTDQFEGLGELLEGLSRELESVGGFEEQMEERVRDYLERLNCPALYSDCCRDSEGRLFVRLDFAPHRAARLDGEKMAKELSLVCECDFDLPQQTERVVTNTAGEQQKVVRLHLREKAAYQAEYAYSQHICQGCRLCGDAWEGFTDPHSVAHMILSDGMGSGTAAAVDSNMTVSLLVKLIDAGVDYTAALKIVNYALLVKSGEESLSTVDVTAVNLYTGQAHFYKAGAAPTFVRRGNRTGVVESTSLPAGILTAVEFEKSSLRLSDGDLIVMVSDGATACGSEWIQSLIDHFAPDGDLQALCDDIASTARLRRNDNHDDDITVAACRIQKSEIGIA